jgi:hypothetical protein
MLTTFFKFFFSLFLLISVAHADEELLQELAYSVGAVSASYAEGAGNLTGENVQKPASGSVMSISGSINWKFRPGIQRSYYLNGTFPLLPNPQGSYFGLHLGMENYFGRMGSRMRLNNSGTTLKLKPGNNYFWGLEAGIGYLAYSTESAKKTDVLLDVGGLLGMNYVYNDNWQFRFTGGLTRGTGVVTTVIEMKVFAGVTYYLAD